MENKSEQDIVAFAEAIRAKRKPKIIGSVVAIAGKPSFVLSVVTQSKHFL